LKALILLVVGAAVLDYLTGVLAAAKGGALSSGSGIKGIYKKLSLFCALALGFFLDAAIPILSEHGLGKEIEISLPFGLIIAAWVVVNESLSVLENLSSCGVRLPGVVARALKAARKKIGE
jgi:toxin secretion/phage lysis holin